MKLLIMQQKNLCYVVQECLKQEIFYLLHQKTVHVRIINAVVKMAGRCFPWSKTVFYGYLFVLLSLCP